MIIQELITAQAAETISERLKGGLPSLNRVLVSVPNELKKTAGGIILPGESMEEVPKRGVLVQIGAMEDSNEFLDKLKVGVIITFGLYAGKEIEPLVLGQDQLPGQKLMCLSTNEIMYIESNTI